MSNDVRYEDVEHRAYELYEARREGGRSRLGRLARGGA